MKILKIAKTATGLGLALALIAISAGTARAIPLVNGRVLTLSTTATALSINSGVGSQFVQYMHIKVIPGQSCKVYVGSLGHTVGAPYTGVWSVLYPNTTGGHSEIFSMEDQRGNDGIDVSTIAVSSDCSGEQVNFGYFQTGTLASSTFRIFKGGPLAPSGSGSTLWGGSTTAAALVRVQIIPGYSGKFRIKGQAGLEIAQLYPNGGNTGQNNAHSEFIQFKDSQSRLRPDLMDLLADVAGEKALVLLGTYF